MTPSLPDILRGHLVVLGTPPPPEASGEFMAGRLGILGLLSVLAAQEAERGCAARVAENAAIRALLARAARFDDALDGRLARAAAGVDDDLSWTALDLANADLRRQLIGLHEAVEARGDAALDDAILALYVEMARLRRLDLATALEE
ncbi:MAG TPA: hypothetical protein VFC47_10800 [Caulobacteraceae bacterium]|nr:hypothetical protein [Caulobacteraceae bacterium]